MWLNIPFPWILWEWYRLNHLFMPSCCVFMYTILKYGIEPKKKEENDLQINSFVTIPPTLWQTNIAMEYPHV